LSGTCRLSDRHVTGRAVQSRKGQTGFGAVPVDWARDGFYYGSPSSLVGLPASRGADEYRPQSSLYRTTSSPKNSLDQPQHSYILPNTTSFTMAETNPNDAQVSTGLSRPRRVHSSTAPSSTTTSLHMALRAHQRTTADPTAITA
jgi:hypothetical protein